MPIAEARIREATQEEQIYYQPNCLWNKVTAPVRFANKLWTTWTLKRNLNNLLAWEVPLVQTVYELSLYMIGMKPEWPYVQSKTSWIGSHVHLKDPKLSEEFFKQHRFTKDGLFSPGRGMMTIGQIIQDCFPGVELEDCIFTCSPERTRLLHNLLIKKLNREEIRAGFTGIRQKAAESVRRMASSEIPFDFTEEARRYTSEVFGLNLLQDAQAGGKIGSIIPAFKNYLIKVYTKTNTEADDRWLEEQLRMVREETEKLLNEKPNLHLFDDDKRTLTLAQKQAMLFVTLFAAQDNTATLLTGMAAHWYNTSAEERGLIREEIKTYLEGEERSPFAYPVRLTNWLEVVLSKYPPVPIVGRFAEKDLCVDFRLDNKNDWHTTFIPKGTIVGAHIKSIGEQFFGGGPHRCPGQDLARVEACELFLQIISNYDLQYSPLRNYHLALQFTGFITPNMMLKLVPIQVEGKQHQD